MTSPSTGPTRTIRHEINSSGLGLSAYPAGTLPNEALDDHIMGVVALAWLTHYPVELWGSKWLRAGHITIRFQRHLRAGRPLETRAEVDEGAATMTLIVRDAAGNHYARGEASLVTSPTEAQTDMPWSEARAATEPNVPPTPAALADLMFPPLHFDFDASRDLAFVDTLPDAHFWHAAGSAHPAWLGSAANAITRRDIDFASGGRWLHAGLGVRLHAPIKHGAALQIAGRIESLFERRGRKFAVASLTVHAGNQFVASLENTFVYAA
jgi:hypothetical protein